MEQGKSTLKSMNRSVILTPNNRVRRNQSLLDASPKPNRKRDRSNTKRTNSLSQSVFSKLGASVLTKSTTGFNNKRSISNNRMTRRSITPTRKSIAQMVVEDKIKPTLKDDQEFLQLFKVSIQNQRTSTDMFKQYQPNAKSSNQEVIQKKQWFVINNGDVDQEFEYINLDPIFELSGPNEDSNAIQNQFCNCCKENYKTIKDARYCQFCSLANCGKCRQKTRVFPLCRQQSRGHICKVCDRKFYMKEILCEGQSKIDIFTNTISGSGGLYTKIEEMRKKIYNQQMKQSRTREIYRLDVDKMHLLIQKLNGIKQKNQTQVDRIKNQNSDMIDKKSDQQERLKELNQLVEDYKIEYAELPEQLYQIDDHILKQHSQKKLLEKEYAAILFEMNMVRVGKNPNNPRPNKSSKNPRDKRNEQKSRGAGMSKSIKIKQLKPIMSSSPKRVKERSNSFFSKMKMSASLKKHSSLHKQALLDSVNDDDMSNIPEAHEQDGSQIEQKFGNKSYDEVEEPPRNDIDQHNPLEDDSFSMPDILNTRGDTYRSKKYADDDSSSGEGTPAMNSRAERMKQKKLKRKSITKIDKSKRRKGQMDDAMITGKGGGCCAADQKNCTIF